MPPIDVPIAAIPRARPRVAVNQREMTAEEVRASGADAVVLCIGAWEFAWRGRGFEPTQIYRGPDLAPGHVVSAPAIIEETFTTIVVYPGWEALVDDSGDYILSQLATGKGFLTDRFRAFLENCGYRSKKRR